MICGENFNVMNQPDILSGRVKPRVGRVEIFNPSAPLFAFKILSVRWKYQVNSTRLRQESWHDGLNEKEGLHSNTSRRCIV